MTDAGGTFTGSPFPATAVLSAPGVPPAGGLEGDVPTFLYYNGTTATGTASATAPTIPGTYTVVGLFAGNSHYAAVQSQPVTLFIVPAATKKLVFLIPPPARMIAGRLGRWLCWSKTPTAGSIGLTTPRSP